MAEKNVPSENKAKKEPLSFKKIVTIIIIAVLALLMVGGVYYVVLMFNQAKAEKSSAWGYYDGEAIVLENNNVFYNTLVNNSDFQTAYLSGDYNTLMTAYQNAYQQQVVFTALTKDAEQAKIGAPQDLVDQLILDAGVYSDEDGNFSTELFNAASEADKISVNTYYTNMYPYQQVLMDLQTTIVSDAESSFVGEIAGKTRSFEYFIINFNAYPDELAEAYGKENADLFATADISIISCTTEDNAKAAYEALSLGSAWTDVVTEYSEDSYATYAGAVGEIQLFAIASNMNDAADIEKLTALEVEGYTEPIQGPYSWAIYRLNNAVEEADFTDSTTLSAVKYYINQNNIDDVSSYVDTAVGIASAQAQTDFDAAAKACDAEIVTVSMAADNIGGSSYIGGLEYYDTTYGYLASAAEDSSFSRELFTSEEGYVTGAIAVSDVENTYIIAKVTGIDDENSTMSSITLAYYGYYAATQPAYDRFYAVFNSDKYTDNFYTQLFSVLFSST